MIYSSIPKHIPPHLSGEFLAVKRLGLRIGFGALMQHANWAWAEVAESKGLGGSESAVGTAKAMTTDCGCTIPKYCDWCCGVGWLTHHVKKVKDSMEKAS